MSRQCQSHGRERCDPLRSMPSTTKNCCPIPGSEILAKKFAITKNESISANYALISENVMIAGNDSKI